MPAFLSVDSSSSGSSTSRFTSSPASSHSHHLSLPQPAEKKKRKQNHACDACKSRRIKCDLSDLPGSSSSCSKCRSKGIACTTIGLLTRAPPKRTGVRIEEAKRTYGSVDTADASSRPGGDQVVSGPVAALSVFGAAPTRTLPQVALCQAVERNLLDMYFSSASYRLQAVDPVEFKQRFNNAGQLSEYMSEGDQVLCAVLCAYGARYTTNPCILPSDSAHLPPSQIGLLREPVCDTLLARAELMMDSFGTLRTPSKESISALVLMIPLVEYREEARRLRTGAPSGSSNVDEAQLLSSIMAQHVDSLRLWEDAQVVGYKKVKRRDGSEELVEVESMGDVVVAQVNEQRLLWAAWISDSLRSTKPRFPNDAIFRTCPQIPRLDKPLPDISKLSDAHCFLLLIASYPMLGEILRYAFVEVISHRDRAPLEKLGKACRIFWRAMDDFGTWFDSLASRLLGSFPTASTFSPISRYVSIKLSQCTAHVLVHRTISKRYELEKLRSETSTSPPYFEPSLGSSAGSSPSSSNGWDSVEPSPLEKASSLHMESSERCLTSGRGISKVISKILNTDFMRAGCAELKDIRIITSFLVEFPVVEQGFHGSLRTSIDWTWSNKSREVSLLLEGLEQVGCGWGLASIVVESIRQDMVINTPFGFPPFQLIRTRPRPSTSPPLDLVGSYRVTPSDIESVYRSSSLPFLNTYITSTNQADGAEVRWSTTSDEYRDASTDSGGRGGFELPIKDFFVFPAFSLDRDSSTVQSISGSPSTGSTRSARSDLPSFSLPPFRLLPIPQPLTLPPTSAHPLPNFQFSRPNSTLPPLPPPSSSIPPSNSEFALPPNDQPFASSLLTDDISSYTSDPFGLLQEEGALLDLGAGGGVGGDGGAGWTSGSSARTMGISESGPTTSQEPDYDTSFEEFLANFPTS